MTLTKEFKQNIKKYYSLLDGFKEEIGFDKFSKKAKKRLALINFQRKKN